MLLAREDTAGSVEVHKMNKEDQAFFRKLIQEKMEKGIEGIINQERKFMI